MKTYILFSGKNLVVSMDVVERTAKKNNAPYNVVILNCGDIDPETFFYTDKENITVEPIEMWGADPNNEYIIIIPNYSVSLASAFTFIARLVRQNPRLLLFAKIQNNSLTFIHWLK